MKYTYIFLLFLFVSQNSFAQSEILSGDCQNGTGTFQYDKGTIYEGEWQNGQRHGSGKMTYARNTNESNLPPGPSGEKAEEISADILAMRERILSEIEWYGIDYLYFHGTDGMIALLNDAEKVGEALGHNVVDEDAENKTVIRDYFEQAKTMIRRAETDEDLTMEAKQYYYNLIHLNYIRNLCNTDVTVGMQTMRDYANSIRNFQDAQRLQIEADDIMLKAYQKMTDDILSTIPLVSTALDVVKIATGEDLNGDQIAASKRAFMAFSILVPEVLERVMVNDKVMKEYVDDFAEQMANMTPESVKKFVETVDIREQYKKSCEVLGEVYPDKKGQLDWLAENYAKAVNGVTIDPLVNPVKDGAFKAVDSLLVK